RMATSCTSALASSRKHRKNRALHSIGRTDRPDSNKRFDAGLRDPYLWIVRRNKFGLRRFSKEFAMDTRQLHDIGGLGVFRLIAEGLAPRPSGAASTPAKSTS